MKDVATKKTIVRISVCVAGGFFEFSLSTTGRFLSCDSNRFGLTLWDLRSKHPDRMLQWGPQGEGLVLAPNDHYAVALPVLTWGGGLPSRKNIDYFNLDTQTRKALAKAPIVRLDPQEPGYQRAPYDVAFCGDGAIFAVAGEHELSVHRGADGALLTAAPAMMGGALSFSASGRFLRQTRWGATTVYRLER